MKEDEAIALITAYKEIGRMWIPIIQRVQEYRDPKDDKFLELAINLKSAVGKGRIF